MLFLMSEVPLCLYAPGQLWAVQLPAGIEGVEQPKFNGRKA